MAFDLFSLPKESRNELEQQYLNFVDKRGPNDCWMWKGHKRSNGYGRFYKRVGKEKYSWQPHALAWMFRYNAPIPSGLLCCHSCDNKGCANPIHIFIGTHKHNVMDSINKNRFLQLRRKTREENKKKKEAQNSK